MFNTKQPLCCDKSSPFISKSSCVFHKTLHFKNPHVFSQNTSFYINHLNLSNYKNLFILLIYVSLHKKYQRPSCVFFTKHYISKILKCSHKTLHFISKHLNPSNYKPCLYNLFVYLYTKNTKDRLVFFHKNTTFQKSSCVLTKTLKSE